MLGLYVSDHPLLGFETALRLRTDATVRELLDEATSPEALDASSAARPSSSEAS